MAQPLILLVEDDPSLRRFLQSTLRRHGFQPLAAETGQEALLMARTHQPDLVLLDLGLPDLEGIDVLKALRAERDVPVLILSARDREKQKVEALDAGADDYLTKPFGQDELLARLRVALRRVVRRDAPQPTLCSGDLCIDLEARRVLRGGQPVRLTPLEYRLLAALANRNGKVVTHQQLLSEVWGPEATAQTQYLHIYMGQLRQKLESDPTRPRHFRTEAGVGYRLEMED